MTDAKQNRDLDPDKETTEAIKALAWRLSHMAADDDPEWVAREYVWKLRSRGWRPTRAKASETWRPNPAGRPSSRVAEHAAEARRQLAERGIYTGVERPAPAAAWCGTCGCTPGRHSSGGCDGCGGCDAYLVSLTSTETDTGADPGQTTPDRDLVGVLESLAGAQRASMPEAPNTADDATQALRFRRDTWNRPVENVDLPEPSQIDTGGSEPPPPANHA